MTTITEARDDIMAAFRVEWNSRAAAANGGTLPKVIWQRVEPSGAQKPKGTEAWARITVEHNEGGQATFGGPGNRLFDREGIVTVQVFTPQKSDQGGTVLEALGAIARDAFEGRSTPSGVWFRDVRLQEVGPDEPWWQLNVTAKFNYDELK
jgi:hypothetical protein